MTESVSTERPHEGLVVRGVSKRFGATQALDHVQLDVRPGEVVALLGENGAGKSTLSNIVAGIFAPDTGTMHLQGAPYAPASPRDAMNAGVGLIYQELRLLPDLTVAENVFVGRLLTRGGRLDWAEMNRRAQEQLRRLGLDVAPTRLVRTLRVAAQQQVEIARALTLDARLVILDEPTRGIDIGARTAIYDVIAELARAGRAVVVVSSELTEVLGLSHRVLVLSRGRQRGVLDRRDATDVAVMHLATE